MVMLATLRRYLPSSPGAHRRRLDELTEEVRQIRAETRTANDRITERLTPLARMAEHLPLLRRELDDFVQSLSVTLRQASERMRELDDRIEALLEHSRIQTDALGSLQSSVLASGDDGTVRNSSLPVPIGRSRDIEITEQLDELRAATERLSSAAGRNEEMLAGFAAGRENSSDPTRSLVLVTVAASGLALVAITVALVALLR